jgi:hypothetical protein
MGDDNRRPASGSLIQRILHNALRLGVERAGGLVKEQDGRVGDDRACDGNALLLPTRKQEPALANGRVVPLREGVDEPVRIGLDARLLDGGEALFSARMLKVGTREALLDVGADRHGEEDGLLRDEADLRAQPADIERAEIRGVEHDGAANRVVEPLEERDDGAFPAARGAHERGCLARAEDEADLLEHLDVGPRWVAERDVPKLNLTHDFLWFEPRGIGGVDGRDAVDGLEELGGCAHGRGYGGDLGSEYCKREGANHD